MFSKWAINVLYKKITLQWHFLITLSCSLITKLISLKKLDIFEWKFDEVTKFDDIMIKT